MVPNIVFAWSNIKITTKDDIIVAESILKKRKDEDIDKERKKLKL